MNDGVTNDGTISDLPWVSVFDPVANARALTAIQARGFSAATQLVDRFVRIAESAATGGAAESAGSKAETTAAVGAGGDVDAMLTAWWSMFGRLLRSMPGAAALRGDGAAFDFAGRSAEGGVRLTADGSGVAAAEVWLHNRGAEDIDSVALRCGDLLAHDGTSVSSAAVRFSPERLALPGRSSRGVTIEVEVAPCAAPGCYRGTLLAEGYPDLWLPVTLTLRAPAG
ncbi:hypothetical protein [Mycobacterium parmense]|uniref:Uncharacterized protein n=1 Tax=Mycobacterium parmense TaxID=185642 RepID=A0A7I7YW51_9MYCO|nr:hypothetical protein [Mycobacterium parmense]MCV7351340.1 hypothetical protein [Mycobacterium parmense]ORW60861.1 hypothetical protein AWC20_07980 [Mycobacterium parmense]BBZ45204.1 hypothetical protein MPRM_24850 [Mycobacterium parmense]